MQEKEERSAYIIQFLEVHRFSCKDYYVDQLRIQCDFQRPICGQCVKTGNTCEGYSREANFINYGVDCPPPSKSVSVKTKISLPKSQTSLQRSALREQCLASFWDSYLPHGGADTDSAVLLESNTHFSANWVKLVPGLHKPEHSLEDAFSALVMARLGRINDDLSLTHSSFRLHSKSISALQSAIRDKSRMLNDETVATVMLLGLYEVSEGELHWCNAQN